MTDTPIALPGYQIAENIYQSQKTLVYRGRRSADGRAVILKLLRREYPTFSELVQFRNQYAIALNLDLPGIVRPLDLQHYRHSFVLVMPDEGYISLDAQMQQWQTGDRPVQFMQQFLAIAIQMTHILEGLYHQRAIHKDIKPKNILIHPETGHVKLTDFSLASLLPREQQEIANPKAIEGTLAYMSPEQTGRMNRGIDYRSDFYSLGVTFYELLTGQRPFNAVDPMELVHCHIARKPTPPMEIDPSIPQAVNDLVLKLMAKTAELRYQSALGLRYDLETCLSRWQETGQILPFTLARRDICDRFVIPEQLYGREAEVTALLAAFDRVSSGTTEMILVAGFSGIGKTAVVNEVHKPIVRKRGYFIKGKFDQFQQNIPFYAFVQAFRDLMRQLLSESEAKLQQWQANILDALSEQAGVIIEVLPELERIIGSQPEVASLSGTAAQNRFNLLFNKFIQVFATQAHPLVIFLDDLQWADSASLQLMQSLTSATDSQYLLLIGAYRDNEVSPVHPLMLTLADIGKTAATVQTITLAPLSQTDINYLIADTLSCTPDLARPLTELLYQKTQGNPFFTNQFLLSLHADGWINFNFEVGYWQCDIVRVRELSLTDDVVEFMAGRLQKLPPATQNILKLAACIGNQFDLATLAIVASQSLAETAASLWKALQEGLILPQSQIYKFFTTSVDAEITPDTNQSPNYQFLHDRVQQGAYFLIPPGGKESTHLQIGQLLLENTPSEVREEKIFAIVNQLNYGIQLIDEQAERDRLAQLNMMAGRKALASTAYEAAVGYLTMGQQLLDPNCWERKYELTLVIYQLAAEATCLNGQFSETDRAFELVRQNALTVLDQVKVYEAKIQACMAQNQPLQAIDIALPFLSRLGVSVPLSPQPADLEAELEEIKANLAGQDIASLIDLLPMTAPEKLAAMGILSKVVPAVYVGVPQLLPAIVYKQVNLSLKYGNTADSAFAYANYGQLLSVVLADIESGYEFGELALRVLCKLNAQELKAKTYVIVNFCLRIWKEHIKETLTPFLEAYQSGLSTGDLEYGSYAALNYCIHSYLVGNSLSELAVQMADYSKQFRQIKQETALNYHEIFRQAVLNLLGDGENPCLLIGSAYDMQTMLPVHQQVNDRLAIFHLSVNQMILSILFAEPIEALTNARRAAEYMDEGTAFIGISIFYFYDSLTQLLHFPEASASARQKIIDRVKANQDKIAEWANYAPMNYRHKFYLVEAERHRIEEAHLAAMEMYDRAIALAKENGYIQEEALANELAGKFYLAWGKETIAEAYITKAYYCYGRWGAQAKIKDLQSKYPHLIAPLQVTDSNSIPSPMPSASTSSSNFHATLDLDTIVKASQTISREIELAHLLASLMEISIQNAGATRGYLILATGAGLRVEAEGLVDEHRFQALPSLPIEGSQGISEAIVNYVARTQETLVLKDATRQGLFIQDPYILQQQPKSILCLPLGDRGHLRGILYLENDRLVGAFTPERVETLNLLAAQAAISLTNSRLYASLQGEIAERKQAEAQLQSSLAEKNILLKEIHHRVKNNLNVIASLLNLQSGYVEDEKVINLFTDSRNRIQTMAMIHEQLYQSPDLARIDLGEYLQNLLNNLFVSYQNSDRKIASHIELEPAMVNLETAVPCGLLVNELIVNSFKHAFPDGRSGEIKLTLTADNDGKYHLTIGDNGEGLPPDFDWESSPSLGLRLVRILARQLRATIEQDASTAGTSFHVTFAELDYAARL